MLLQLTDLSYEPLSEQIARQLSDKILHGELPPGTAMQAIRAMARHQRVSIETVRRAYHDLAADGLLEISATGAFYVSELSEKERQALTVQHQLGKTLLLHQADSFSRQVIALVHMQKRLLPAARFTDAHVSIAAYSEPSALVGGDLYDYFTLDRHRYGLIVADACGHGLPAAMLMAQMHGLLKSKVQNGNHLDDKTILLIKFREEAK